MIAVRDNSIPSRQNFGASRLLMEKTSRSSVQISHVMQTEIH